MFQVENRDADTLDGLIATWIRPGSVIHTDGARVYDRLLQRFGEFDGLQGLGQHLSVNQQFVDYIHYPRPHHHIFHRVTTNHIEANWRQLKENIGYTSEFIDVQDNRRFMISGYIDYCVFCRRKWVLIKSLY